MIHFHNVTYPAFIKKQDGTFGVYFPTLFPEHGADYPLATGHTQQHAIANAQKELAYTLAGMLYDNETLPPPMPFHCDDASQQYIEMETSFEPYAEEINAHLRGRHWHIDYYDANDTTLFSAVGYKNENGQWDIYFNDALLFTVIRYAEAEKQFHYYAEHVLLPNLAKNSRGLSFQIPNAYGTYLCDILHNINVTEFFWHNGNREAYRIEDGQLGRDLFPPASVLDGNTLQHIISDEPYYIIFADLKAFQHEADVENIANYEQFIQSNCQLVLLVVDCSYVYMYVKDPRTLAQIHANAVAQHFENIQFITDDNDELTTFVAF